MEIHYYMAYTFAKKLLKNREKQISPEVYTINLDAIQLFFFQVNKEGFINKMIFIFLTKVLVFRYESYFQVQCFTAFLLDKKVADLK